MTEVFEDVRLAYSYGQCRELVAYSKTPMSSGRDAASLKVTTRETAKRGAWRPTEQHGYHQPCEERTPEFPAVSSPVHYKVNTLSYA